jgi:fumarate hydratase class II
MGQRKVKDSMGEMPIDENCYWGAQTERARLNFPISELRIPRLFKEALAGIKIAAARVNARLHLIPQELADAIEGAGTEIMNGGLTDQFPVDVFQTGSGTSWNMNMNEVISTRANEILGSELSNTAPVHPNDHVNRSQSSNDCIPTAMNLANLLALARLIPALEGLQAGLEAKAKEFKGVIKIGRTHLQDAVPMTLGQEFSAFAQQIKESIRRLENARESLRLLPQGGTALGTGLNAPFEFGQKMTLELSKIFGLDLAPAPNPFEAIANRDPQVELMGAMNSLAVSLMKIGNDLRLLSSGPRTALAEITLPSLQPGSSIMPGKVNPVIPEMLIQGCARIMGAACTTTIAGQNGPLQLNIMMPLLAYETLFAQELAANMVSTLDEKCIRGIKANEENCRAMVEQSLAMVTPLALEIGYDQASALAYKAFQEHKTIRELVKEQGLLPDEKIDEILDASHMI